MWYIHKTEYHSVIKKSGIKKMDEFLVYINKGDSNSERNENNCPPICIFWPLIYSCRYVNRWKFGYHMTFIGETKKGNISHEKG